MRHILRILGPLTLLGLLAGGVSTANAFQLVLSGNPYLCAVVEGGKTAAGTPVIAYPCSGGPEDQWEMVGGQFLGIGTANGSTMCLDVKGAGTAPGTLVDLWPCNGQENQQWNLVNGEILGVQSSKCLDGHGGPKVGGGVQLVVNSCSSAATQDWTLNGIQIQAASNTPYVCANVRGSKTANGTPVIDYSCDDPPNELWSYVGSELRGIGTENGTFKCLTASSLNEGALVELSLCNGQLNQLWSINSLSQFADGYQAIFIQYGDILLCLDSLGGSSGTQLEVSNYNCTISRTNWNLR